MKQLNPYLIFPGNAEEAMNFYKDILGLEAVTVSRFGDIPADAGMPPMAEDRKQKIMHATLRGNGIEFMLSDAMQGQPTMSDSNISMSMNMDDPQETEELFNKLSAGGKITMPFQQTFWGAKFGMFTDKFGVNWMFNCDLKK